MLQICSGKLFSKGVKYRNNLKGVIYTNLRITRDKRLDTAVGSLWMTNNANYSNAILFEFEELIEDIHGEPNKKLSGEMISHGIDNLILDFSSILSFFMNCTASPSHSITERLLSDQIGVSTHKIPKQVINRVFDQAIYCQENDEELFKAFVKQLIGLKRKTFLAVMRAIQTYVTGMQRVADDLELSYTLIVASLESLAQNFDGYKSTWDHYDSKKKKAIDEALCDADEEVSNKVKNAVLEGEHTALGSRFRRFTIENIAPSYFREEAKSVKSPISRFDLDVALKNAYLARSKYVHQLNKLPKRLTFGGFSNETCFIDNKAWFTLQGLSRLARHVIIQFIMKQDTVENEPYDYTDEQPNKITLPMSPVYFLHLINLSDGMAGKIFEGLLLQFEQGLMRTPNIEISNLSHIIEHLQKGFNNLNKKDREIYLAIFIMYTSIDPESVNREDFIHKYSSIIEKPSSASLVIHCLCIMSPNWSLSTHYECLLNYFKERDHKTNFRAPKSIESLIILQLAELYRQSNDNAKVLQLLEMAVENYPDYENLQQFEINYKAEACKINNFEILFPEKDNTP
ncbi:hypothetical protein [Acinetobacter silvestris]|uniref:Uncharacterized protein n=1 Tax=Acinetobacter silvestris TaxID=1977882 RepID=A0A1Y3C8I4_9GAMM|nr:hypothetical protein [Acinetobacter silvestris]OTG62435.1 hypothetical protein B9T28_14460 [Acinetobacter silvestris]